MVHCDEVAPLSTSSSRENLLEQKVWAKFDIMQREAAGFQLWVFQKFLEEHCPEHVEGS